jgi:glycosyltransferase involved in cell wall biosynthesis
LVVGSGESVHPKVDTCVLPELASHGGPVGEAVESLHKGRVPKSFPAIVEGVAHKLHDVLQHADVCIMHNVLTMHFNLVLTAALANIMREHPEHHFIGWTHDATFVDPAYTEHQRKAHPWNLLSQALPGCRYCVISRQRQKEIADLFGVPVTRLPVIPDGIAIRNLLGLTGPVSALYKKEELYRKDIVVLTPTRIVRRKHLEVGIEIVAALKRLGQSVRWMITGAADPHSDESKGYYRELLRLRRKHNLEKEMIFLSDHFKKAVSNEDMRGLYGVSNVLLFPSEREGFGIPVLEAGIYGLLVVISDIPSLRELGGRDTVYIYPNESADTVACRVVRAFGRSPRLVFKRRVIANYSWDAVFADKIRPAVLHPNAVWKRRGRK